MRESIFKNQICLRIPDEFRKGLQQIAKKRSMKLAEVLREAIYMYLNGEKAAK